MVKCGTQFVFAGLVILALVQVGTCLTCFDCDNLRHGDGICRDQQGNKHVTKVCSPSQVCVTLLVNTIDFRTLNYTQTEMRTCGDPQYCQVQKKKILEAGIEVNGCVTCEKDYCNSGSTLVPSLLVVALLGVKYLLA